MKLHMYIGKLSTMIDLHTCPITSTFDAVQINARPKPFVQGPFLRAVSDDCR